MSSDSLAELVALAQTSNPRLQRLAHLAQSAWQRVPQARALPDPMVRGTVYGEPMMMPHGEIRGSFMFSQMIPWLKRLDAEGQRRAFEAMALEQTWQAERLRVVADVKAAYYRLYLIEQQLQINEANRQLLDAMTEVATSRIIVGAATQGDVLLATVELGQLAEERVTLRQQHAAAAAALNRLLDRPADCPVPSPESLDVPDRTFVLGELRALASQAQPEIVEARLRTQATAWGIRVAALERVPDLTLSYERMFMGGADGGMQGDSARDPWQVGAGINIPLWRRKYKAMEQEATREHFAARAGVAEVVREYDAMIFELFEELKAARETAKLFEGTILPQARQTLEADQQAYAQGQVEFDRVISDIRSLLTIEISYHRAISSQATALARLERAVGIELGQTYDSGREPPVPPAPASETPTTDAGELNEP